MQTVNQIVYFHFKMENAIYFINFCNFIFVFSLLNHILILLKHTSTVFNYFIQLRVIVNPKLIIFPTDFFYLGSIAQTRRTQTYQPIYCIEIMFPLQLRFISPRFNVNKKSYDVNWNLQFQNSFGYSKDTKYLIYFTRKRIRQ